jgi:hypothetical protein
VTECRYSESLLDRAMRSAVAKHNILTGRLT